MSSFNPIYITVGSILEDVTYSMEGNVTGRKLGGGALNVALGVNDLLDGRSLFIGAIGSDERAERLLESVKSRNLNIVGVFQEPEHETAFADVYNKQLDDGTVKPHYDKTQGATPHLTNKQVQSLEHLFEGAEYCLLFPATMLPGFPIAQASDQVLEFVEKYKLKLVFDLNIRFGVWEQHYKEKAKEYLFDAIKKGIEKSTVLKMNDAELLFINKDFKNIQEAENYCAHITQRQFDLEVDEFVERHSHFDWKLLVVTRGMKGSNYLVRLEDSNIIRGQVDASVFKDDVLSTVGCGDAFTAGLLVMFDKLSLNFDSISKDHIVEAMKFSSDFAAGLIKYI